MMKRYIKPVTMVHQMELESMIAALSVGSGTKSAEEALARKHEMQDDLLSFDVWEDRGLYNGADEEEE